jgi:hypothetical protein
MRATGEVVMSDIVKICKIHGELIESQCRKRPRKLVNGNDVIYYECKQCSLDTKKEWCKNNPEKVRAHTTSEKYRTRTNAWRREKYRTNPEKYKYEIIKNNKKYKDTIRKNIINKTYGLSIEDHKKLLEKQNNVCAICKKPETSVKRKGSEIRPLAIDHCHKTKKNRGLLCTRCNTALGLLKEDPNIMSLMIGYIKAHQ